MLWPQVRVVNGRICASIWMMKHPWPDSFSTFASVNALIGRRSGESATPHEL
jgi:hypothetical protein